MGTKRVNVTLTDKNGCTIKIDGDVKFSLVPPSIDKFTGTITLSGGKGCPKGTLVFLNKGKPSGKKLIVTFDKNDLSKVSKISWRGDTPVVATLNDRMANRALCSILRAAPFVDAKLSLVRS